MPLLKMLQISKSHDFNMLFSRILARVNKYFLNSIIGLLLAILSMMLFVMYNDNKSTLINNIYIDNICISGLNKQNAIDLLENQLTMQYRNNAMKLIYDNVFWIVKLEDIALKLEIENTVENVFRIDKQGSFFDRLRLYCNFKKQKIQIKTEITYNHSLLTNILEKIGLQIYQEEKNATVSYKSGIITLNNDIIGIILNIDLSIEMIENCINERAFEDIVLITTEIKPEIIYDDIKEINSMLSYFTTYFNEYDLKRTNNIKVACDRINYTVLKPGDVFSIDIAIGKRTVENGYMDAPIIMNNELIQGLGGGVCQVTTTLYNSVLKAKLDVLERTHHSMPLAYVEVGLDATLAENLFDFKFSNSKESAICIIADVVGNSIKFSILGKKDQIQTNVVLKSEIVGEYMPVGDEIIYESSVPKGEIITVREARKGLKVIVYRETYDRSGKLIDREQVSVDYYPPLKAIIKMNPIHKDKN